MARPARPLWFALASLAIAGAARAGGPMEGPWPHRFQQQGFTFLLYQPEVQSWERGLLRERAVVAVQDGDRTSYGVLQVEARAQADRGRGLVHVTDARVVKAQFPGAGSSARAWRAAFEAQLPAAYDEPLDRIEEGLAIARAQKAQARRVQNAPPEVVFRTHPALLVLVDGKPQWRSIEGTPLERVVNTRPLLVRDPARGTVYLHLLDGWMSAAALQGPYTVVKELPAALAQAYAWATKQHGLDLLEAKPDAAPAAAGSEPDAKKVPPPTLAAGAPEIVVATRPTALVLTEGEPQLEPIADTGFASWKNTSSDVLVDEADGSLYLLLAGRWFTAEDAEGPWSFVEAKDLPPGFSRIPVGHAKESVLASVPGTPQAREALIANQVPQTATVKRSEARYEARFDGAPQLAPIEGTPLSYVRNSATPIIEVDPAHWYAVVNGVWFSAGSPSGPWSVATSVPAVIYTIPPSSPLHSVTYVRVYDATPDEVYVGYTPGYMGTYVANGVVVYGTGFWYTPWVGSAWYGWPVTYGYGVRIGWSSWYGWGVSCWYGWHPPGYWWGFGVGPYWGPMVVYRPVFYGYARPAYFGYYHGVAPAPPRASVGVYGQWNHAAVAAAPHPAPALAGAARPAPPASALGRPGPMAPHLAALTRAGAPGHPGGSHPAAHPPVRRGGGRHR
ncbi:MAG TPA: hypothetical protein VM683_09520 [Anaeromyxobacteraceae bacterium]|nr:hypothetical protein [Anaeromyxobacteraceae bacterium]